MNNEWFLARRGKPAGKYAIRLKEDEHQVGVDGWGIAAVKEDDENTDPYRWLTLTYPKSYKELIFKIHWDDEDDSDDE